MSELLTPEERDEILAELSELESQIDAMLASDPVAPERRQEWLDRSEGERGRLQRMLG